jgi:glycyl-tRNA synthetase
MNFQEFILALTQYWMDKGCIWTQPYDQAMGAGTFHTHTFLKGIGPEPWKSVYVQPCRRPVDGRYGESPYRFQSYYQLQVLLKPAPSNIVQLFLDSLEHIGIPLKDHDVGLLEDNWKGPTLGAWGQGWEIRANGQEITQFTYFQQLGGLDVDVVCGEITYGLERLYMYAFGYQNAFDIPYNETFTYGDIFKQNEYEFSFFNFKEANIDDLIKEFETSEKRVYELCEKNLVLPAYDFVLKASHAFNLLDARGAISVSERQRYIGRVRDCAKACALIYKASREKLGYPILQKKLAQAPSISYEPSSLDDFYKLMEGRSSSQVLLELGVEEMPPSFQKEALKEIKNGLDKSFETFSTKGFVGKDEVTYEVFLSSRRMILVFQNVPYKACVVTKEIWGPPQRIAQNEDGSLSRVAQEFCEKNQIPLEKATFESKDNKGAFLYAKIDVLEGQFLTLLLQDIKNIIYNLSAETKMKWPSEEPIPSFVRPVRWFLALADEEVIPYKIFDLVSDRFTKGHRILTPEAKSVPSFQAFFPLLRSYFVEFDQSVRRQKILDDIQKALKPLNLTLMVDEELMDFHVGQSESPWVFLEEFDKNYLRMPEDLIISVLKKNMMYFCTKDSNGVLTNVYVGVGHYEPHKPKEAKQKTKDVVVGRLDDGLFYFENDLAKPLSELREATKTQVFQAKLGTLYDKSERLKDLIEKLYDLSLQSSNASTLLPEFLKDLKKEGALNKEGAFNEAEKPLSSSSLEGLKEALSYAALFSKADLKTGCVQEFPDEMQGVMGGVLVEAQNPCGPWSSLVALAIKDQYKPSSLGEEDVPRTLSGCFLALSDRLDSLCVMMNHGYEVKGSKDPFGLRRLALGILRLLGLNAPKRSLPFSLNEVLSCTFETMAQHGFSVHAEEKIKAFISDRLKVVLRQEFEHSLVEALERQFFSKPLMSLQTLLKELKVTIDSSSGSLKDVVFASKRLKNILNGRTDGLKEVDINLFKEPSETKLWQVFLNLKNKDLETSLEDYLHALKPLSDTLEEYFKNVIVLDKDETLKRNRLSLLLKIDSWLNEVCEFSALQITTGEAL